MPDKTKKITEKPGAIEDIKVEFGLSELIYQQIPKVMADIGAIGKDRKNEGQGYKFRGIDDLYNELQQHLSKHKVFTVPCVLKWEREERESKKGGTLIFMIMTVLYTVFAEDGSSVSITVVGEAMDAGGDKATNKAMSAAHKYALLQLFTIPTEEPKDSENDNPELGNVKNEKLSRTTPGAGKTNDAMDEFMAGQAADNPGKSESLDHDFNQQHIAEKCQEAGLDYKTFKQFLNATQEEMGKKFVGDMYGNLSFMAGKEEDVKALVKDIDKAITACKAAIKAKSG